MSDTIQRRFVCRTVVCVVAALGWVLPSWLVQEVEGEAPRGAVEPGTHDWSLEHGELTRTYRIHIPPSYAPSDPPPLILAFHGGGGRGRGTERLTGLSELSDREGFVVVYPDGVGRTWNDGRGLERFPAMQQMIDDVGFVSALIDELADRLSIDVGRVYATGISNGGHFSHRLGVEIADKLAAIAPVAASMPLAVAEGNPSHPLGVIQFFGTEDRHNYWQGGGRAGGESLSVPEVMSWWARHNGATDEPDVEHLPNLTDDGTRIRRETWPPGRGGVQTVLYAIEGGGHTWPGGWQYMDEAEIGRTTRDINGSEVMWEFFSQHRRERRAGSPLGDTREPAAGDSSASFPFDGLPRSYHVHVPPSYDGTGSVPLVVVLHLGLADGKTIEKISGFSEIADREGFIVVYPDGHMKRWAGPGLTTPKELVGVDDVGFITEVMDRVARDWRIDSSRLYVAGMCRGGFLAQMLACEHPERFAAIAAVTTFQTEEFGAEYGELGRPVPVLVMNSTEDMYVPFAGGPLPLTPEIEIVSSRAIVEKWVDLNGCRSQPLVTDLPDSSDDGTRARREVYAQCEGTAEVASYVVEGGGHTWPGGWQYMDEDEIGRTSRDLDASEIIWEFFSRHTAY
jgi:polyhydroxybutyrate depolymerase